MDKNIIREIWLLTYGMTCDILKIYNMKETELNYILNTIHSKRYSMTKSKELKLRLLTDYFYGIYK